MVRIKSITDVITNSSSEVVIIHPRGSETPQSILEDLLKVHEEFMEEGSDRYSGDCQDIELLPGRGYKIHKKLYWPEFLIDNGFIKTIEYIKEHYCIHKIEYR